MLITLKKETYQSHFIGVKNLFEYFNKKNIKKFIQIGSSSEYGKIPSPQKEIKLGKPKMIYGKSKMKASKVLLKKFKTNKFPVVILRLYQVYGPNQSINRLIPFVIYSSLKDKVFPCSSGFQKRDFIFIDDVISAIMLALKKSKCNGKIINIGFGKSYKVKNIINFILKSIKKGKPNFDKIKLRIDEGKILPRYFLVKRHNWKPKLNIKRDYLKQLIFTKKMIKSVNSLKILVMGLPGAGKTTLAEKLSKKLSAEWINADKVKKGLMIGTFLNGRLSKQKNEKFSKKSYDSGKIVVADFVCPISETRKDFDADLLIWIDTIKSVL